MFELKNPGKKAGLKVPLRFAMSSVVTLLVISLIFATVYYYIDQSYDDKESRLKGIADKTNFGNYIYYAIIITSTLGLGEIVPHPGDEKIKPSWKMRTTLCIHIFTFIFVNSFMDSLENYILVL